MYLALTNNTTTVVLNNDTLSVSAGMFGSRYFPRDGGDGETVVETIEQVFSGTVANVRATFATVKQLLSEATERARGNKRIPALYLIHNPAGGVLGAYRSEVVGGRHTWSANRNLRQMGETNTAGEAGIIIERVNYFETIDEVQLVTNWTIVNGNTLPYNYVTLGTPIGDLPSPVRISITNIEGVDILAENFYLQVDSFVGLTTSQHFLPGDSATWGAPITAEQMILEAAIPDAVLAKCGGEEMNILAAFTDLPSDIWLKPVLYTLREGLYLPTLYGKEKNANGAKLVNLGALSIPASGYASATSGAVLGINARCSTAGTATLDFIQIAPARDMINLYYNDYDMPNNSVIHDDGIFPYFQEGSNKFDTVFRTGGPLRVWPNRINRLTMLMEEGAAYDKTRNFRIDAWYRPRRNTI